MTDSELSKKLSGWRDHIARTERTEAYKVLQNATIEEIVRSRPETLEALALIKGIGPKKLERYGGTIIAFVKGEARDEDEEEDEGLMTSGVLELSVSGFWDIVNRSLLDLSAKVAFVRGEISELAPRENGVYMTIKDGGDGSTLRCFVSAWVFEGLEFPLENGMEVKVSGTLSAYKKGGSVSFYVRRIELAGEGALRRAYELLKQKLEAEGLFARKRPLPEFIGRIGLITSKDGAVISDFRTNLEPLGIRVFLYDVRVEGTLAVKEVAKAVRWFNERMADELDALVIIRGGGSLESLQAFNDESVARAVFASKIPTICGIGHDKDVPITSMVADVAVSTPSIAAMIVNRSWERLRKTVPLRSRDLLSLYERALFDARGRGNAYSAKMFGYFRSIFVRSRALEKALSSRIERAIETCARDQVWLTSTGRRLHDLLSRDIRRMGERLSSYEVYLAGADPERNLRLGYSILRGENGAIVRDARDVRTGERLTARLHASEIVARVEERRALGAEKESRTDNG